MLTAGALVGGALAARAADIPYSPNEFGRLQAFLQCPSMVEGKSNAELLGANLDDPATWSGVSWVDYDPDGDHEVKLSAKHVLHIAMGGSLAGALEVRDFPYMESFGLDHRSGTVVGKRSLYTSIVVKNNARLGGVHIGYANVASVEIGGNPILISAIAQDSNFGTFTLEQPNLTTLVTGEITNSSVSFSLLPRLRELELGGWNNITTLNLSACPDLGFLVVGGMPNLQTLHLGNKPALGSATINNNPKLTGVDVNGMAQLHYLECQWNDSLTSVRVGGNPLLDDVVISRNSALASLALVGLPELWLLDCQGNAALQTLTLQGNPKLKVVTCPNNALTALDLSGLSALKELVVDNNQLTRLDSAGVQFTSFWAGSNKMKQLSANVGGCNISVKAYADAGYVSFDASGSSSAPGAYVGVNSQGLPAPLNTEYRSVEGLNHGSGQITSDTDMTVFFDAPLHFISYFEKETDNPFGTGVDFTANPIVGDPVGEWPSPEFLELLELLELMGLIDFHDFPLWSKTGYVLEGWYTDPELTQKWDLLHDIICGELTLYPNWVPVGVPMVFSVTRQSPTNEFTTATNVIFRVTFSEVVTGVDPADFALTTTGTAGGSITAVSSSSGQSVDVTVKTLAGSGTVRLDVKAAGTGIVNLEGRTLSRGFFWGQTYSVGGAAALGAFLQSHGIDPKTPAGAADADPDGDGANNLLEFVCGGDPRVRDAAILPKGRLITAGFHAGV